MSYTLTTEIRACIVLICYCRWCTVQWVNGRLSRTVPGQQVSEHAALLYAS